MQFPRPAARVLIVIASLAISGPGNAAPLAKVLPAEAQSFGNPMEFAQYRPDERPDLRNRPPKARPNPHDRRPNVRPNPPNRANVARPYPHDRRYDGRSDDRNDGAAAVGAIMGLFLGAVIATEAQRGRTVSYCMQRYRSYDPGSMTYLGYDGRRHRCP